jgi:hypothetical protein
MAYAITRFRPGVAAASRLKTVLTLRDVDQSARRALSTIAEVVE